MTINSMMIAPVLLFALLPVHESAALAYRDIMSAAL
jgi:hypothetical protein